MSYASDVIYPYIDNSLGINVLSNNFLGTSFQVIETCAQYPQSLKVSGEENIE